MLDLATYLQAIPQPTTPNRFPTKKKFLRPKMSEHLPAMVMTTALATAQAVAIQAILLDGPTLLLMVMRIAAGSARAKREAS